MRRLKRMGLMTLVGGTLLVVLTYGTALAETIRCVNVGDELGGVCYGTDEDDNVYGTSQEDFIRACDGSDYVMGYDDDDTIYGGDGDDNRRNDGGLFGGDDDDDIYGGEGDDDMYGGSGADELRDAQARRDVDRAFGQGGNDFIDVADGDRSDLVNCGTGDRDRAIYDRGDEVKDNCERARRQ